MLRPLSRESAARGAAPVTKKYLLAYSDNYIPYSENYTQVTKKCLIAYSDDST